MVWFKILEYFAGFDRIGHGVLLRRRRRLRLHVVDPGLGVVDRGGLSLTPIRMALPFPPGSVK